MNALARSVLEYRYWVDLDITASCKVSNEKNQSQQVFSHERYKLENNFLIEDAKS